MLIIAASYPFAEIIGVEYSPQLVEVCHKNLETVGVDERCEVMLGDAAEYVFPDGDVLVFLYNPFDAVVLERVLAHLAARRFRTRLAQLGPGHDVVRASGARLVCSSGTGPAIYEMLARESA